jgi:hypothetical protein
MAKYELARRVFTTREDAEKAETKFLKDYPSWPFNSATSIQEENGLFYLYCEHDGSN